jgi:hypothetical protein
MIEVVEKKCLKFVKKNKEEEVVVGVSRKQPSEFRGRVVLAKKHTGPAV